MSSEKRAKTAAAHQLKLKVHRSTTAVSAKTQSVYKAQKRYPTALYKNRLNNELRRMKAFDVTGSPVFYAHRNENAYIYPHKSLLQVTDENRKNSLCGGDASPISPENDDAIRIRPFTYLHRLPTALYRNGEQTVKIKVYRKYTR